MKKRFLNFSQSLCPLDLYEFLIRNGCPFKFCVLPRCQQLLDHQGLDTVIKTTVQYEKDVIKDRASETVTVVLSLANVRLVGDQN